MEAIDGAGVKFVFCRAYMENCITYYIKRMVLEEGKGWVKVIVGHRVTTGDSP